MPSTITISDIPVIIARNSLRIEQRIESRSMASFTVIDKDGTQSYVRGQPVIIEDPDSVKVFGGFINTSQSFRISPSGLKYHLIQCMDNHYLADKRLAIKAYFAKTAGYIIDDLFDSYLADEEITIGKIQEGPTLVQAVFNLVKVSRAISAVAEMAGFTWYIDENKELYFIARETNVALWEFTNDKSISIPKLTVGNPLYRNRQYIRGGTGVTDEKTESFTGDGQSKSFALGFPLAQVPVVTVNGFPQELGIKGVQTGKPFYWNKGDAVITAEDAPDEEAVIICIYYGQYPLITVTSDEEARMARQAIEGGTGIVEDIVDEVQHESEESSSASGQSKILQYCTDSERFNFQTKESGLKPGQLLTITYEPFGFSAHKMLIESITISADGDFLAYDVQAINGPAMGSWTKFFADLLGRQDKILKIGESMMLALLTQSEEFALDEATDFGSHLTEDYKWDDDDTRWDFFTWA